VKEKLALSEVEGVKQKESIRCSLHSLENPCNRL
jgi:hypothetical protein